MQLFLAPESRKYIGLLSCSGARFGVLPAICLEFEPHQCMNSFKNQVLCPLEHPGLVRSNPIRSRKGHLVGTACYGSQLSELRQDAISTEDQNGTPAK